MRPLFLVLAASALAVSACSPTCASTCQRYYEADACDAPPAGLDRQEAVAQCVSICRTALATTGPAPDAADPRFDPSRISPPEKSPQIVNEAEAGAWMDCVWSFSDEDCPAFLGDQYCVRVF